MLAEDNAREGFREPATFAVLRATLPDWQNACAAWWPRHFHRIAFIHATARISPRVLVPHGLPRTPLPIRQWFARSSDRPASFCYVCDDGTASD
jgi:hypothetical protein